MRRGVAALAWVYGVVTRLRNALYDRRLLHAHRVELPVISVGNITAGGNGKTPVVLALVEMIKASGGAPVVLSRGYGGRVRGPYLVQPTDSPAQVGDEPLMMARRTCCPIVVARDRVAGARWIVKHLLGSVIVLDDGFQHRRLHRDLDLVSVDVSSTESGRAFLQGSLIPAGYFREQRESAIARADIIVLNHRQPEPEIDDCTFANVRALCRDRVVISAFSRGEPPRLLTSGAVVPPGPVAAFCAIANPTPFFTTLAGLGYTVTRRSAFPDHHTPSPADLSNLRSQGLPVVCTEKDSVKLSEAELEGVAVVRIQSQFHPVEPVHAALRALLTSSPTRSEVVS